MAVSSFSLLIVYLMLSVAPHGALSKTIPEWTSSEQQDSSSLQQDDSTIEKRSVSGSNSGISLNFQRGMRDFIVNGKGVTVHPGTTVAFQATMTTGLIGPNYAQDSIKFNEVSINIGNGYNPTTGKFTAPVKGLYQISYAYLQRNGYRSLVHLVKNNAMIDQMEANHKNYDTLSKVVLVMLNKGDTLWVRLVKGAEYSVYGLGRYTKFGGLLIPTA